MKYFVSIFSLTLILSTGLFAQVTNLTVNSSSTTFTMASGDMISWSYNLPVGGTADIQIWIDTDQNNLLDENTDVLWQAFTQTDGAQGNNGPPDIDGTVNGSISFGMAIGLAPAHYIMSFKNNNVGQTVIGIVTPLASPTFTISGSITPAQANVVFNLSTNADNGTFWLGISDASGNFQIKMGADTSGNPWRLRIDNSYLFGTSTITPQEYQFTIDAGVATAYSGKDFTVTASAADIVGVLKDENGDPIIDGSDVWAWADNGNFNRYTRTDYTGTYRMGFSASELPIANLTLGSGDQWDTSFVSSQYTFSQINSGDHLTHDLYRYKTNSTIEGQVTFDNNPPNTQINLFASNPDTGGVQTLSDMNGYFIFHVSDKIYNYNINLNYMLQGYNYNTVVAHPGDKNVIVNLSSTGISDNESSQPTDYSLSQNYPNPFNPSTAISYSLPISGHITLKVFNILGNEVTTLVNEDKAAGKYNIKFEASNLPSGIYFYKIQTGSFSETKKMILLK
jgi:hypothetical protein